VLELGVVLVGLDAEEQRPEREGDGDVQHGLARLVPRGGVVGQHDREAAANQHEGVEGAEKREKAQLPSTDPLSDSDAKSLLKRIPEIKPTGDDQTDFAKRVGSLPAPKTGNKIPVKFPSDEMRNPPNASGGQTLRIQFRHVGVQFDCRLLDDDRLIAEGVGLIDLAAPNPRHQADSVRLELPPARVLLENPGGACAAAVSAIATGRADTPVRVEMRGGAVEVSWGGEGSSASLTGPASQTFRAEIELENVPT